MNFSESRIILTGAGSGIGRHLALQLAKRGAKLALVGRNKTKLDELCAEIGTKNASSVVFDLSASSGHEKIVEEALGFLGGIDVLVNNAGISGFGEFSKQSPEDIQKLIQTNVAGPIQLSRAVLPHFLKKGEGKIVNVGSTFGSIGFGHFSVYSSTKFALRGFSESLRRELDHTKIEVCYVAPRATKTPLNEGKVVDLNERTGVSMDDPRDVASQIIFAMAQGRKDFYIGWPEKFFVRLNALLPRAVDSALRKNNEVARELLNIG